MPDNECSTCKRTIHSWGHTCPPAWYVTHWGADEPADSWRQFYAETVQDAVRQHASWRGCYDDAPDWYVVWVRPAGDGEVLAFEIQSEIVHRYNLEEITLAEAARAYEA